MGPLQLPARKMLAIDEKPEIQVGWPKYLIETDPAYDSDKTVTAPVGHVPTNPCDAYMKSWQGYLRKYLSTTNNTSGTEVKLFQLQWYVCINNGS